MTPPAVPWHALLLRALVAIALWPLVAFGQAPGWETGTDGLAPIPALSARVTDLTGTLAPAERQALEAKLAAFEQKTGGQIAVLLIPSTQPEPIEAYSIRLADAWKIGRKGRDDGAILVVAKNDRKLRIEVGYGYEGVLTDAMSRRIIAETITPLFRQGQFAAGIDAGVDRIIGVVGRDPSAAAPPQRAAPRSPGIDPGMLLLVLLVVLPAVASVLRRIFGKVGGATVGAGLVGTAVAVLVGSILIGVFAGIIAWLALLMMGAITGRVAHGGRTGMPGPWIGGGGWGGGGGLGGGGGWGGGGGGFGGGGASGSW